MTLDSRTRRFATAVAAAGALVFLATLAGIGHPTDQSIVRAGVLMCFLGMGWAWPVVMYRNVESESLNLDEGILVVLLMTERAPVVIAAVVIGTALAQLCRRRALIKTAFNVGDMALAAGAATGVRALVGVVGHSGPVGSPIAVGAVVAGAAAWFAVNTVLLAGVISMVSGHRFRETLLDGLGVRVLVVSTCVVIGVPTGLAIVAHPWLVVAAFVPFVVVRQVLVGHFQARHDHSRVSALLSAAIEVNGTMQPAEVETTVLGATRTLLRSSSARVDASPGQHPDLAVALTGLDRWLVVDGRSNQEPVDDTDRALLATLAAVASTALRNAELFEQVRAQQEQLATLTASLGEAVVAVDVAGAVTFVNPVAEAMLPQVRVGEIAPIHLRLAAQRSMTAGVILRDEDTAVPAGPGRSVPVALTASPVHGPDGVAGAVLVLADIAERKAFEEELARHGFEDPLTALPNRRLFLDRLRLALRRGERSGARHAVLFIDIDRFKTVNDSLGHYAGDELLVAIADRLRGVVRGGDTLARLGGDEFVALIEDVEGIDEARALADQMAARLDSPIMLTGQPVPGSDAPTHEVFVSASIGVAVSSASTVAEDLLRDADVAMYQAKHKGRGRREVFDAARMGARSAARLDLEVELRRGVERGELAPYYQPIVKSSDGTIIGAEALVRWNHPTRGLLAPASFIGVAEDTALILPIGKAVLEQACADARDWVRRGFDLSVSVNLSARQFGQPDLVTQIAAALDGSGLRPDRLCLEIVETLAMEDPERTMALISRLHEVGVRFAVDDFGTGYSSLNYLKRFPVDEVKIDRSFVAGLGSDPVDGLIVRTIVSLVSALGMTAVAEGVETCEQLAVLRTLDCAAAQGFLFSRPLAPEQFLALVEVDRPFAVVA